MSNAQDNTAGRSCRGQSAVRTIQVLGLLGTGAFAVFLWTAWSGRYWPALAAGLACFALYFTAARQLERVGPG